MRILIAYATRTGSTQGVAEAIARVFCDVGDRVDVLDAEDITHVGEYDGVIIGSAIRIRRWLSEARELITENEDVLARMPVAYFAVGLTLVHKRAGGGEVAEAESYAHLPEKSAPSIHPVSTASFAGALYPDRLSLGERAITAAFGVPAGDYRDFDAIRAWATEVRQAFVKARQPVRV